jgi:HPt (histidine-containing phosphotransfer) domain-containing protein
MATEFDEAQLQAITGGDREFELEILQEYLNSVPRDVEKLKAAVAAGDAAATGAVAHALKGASATIGAKGLAATALVLEKSGKAADTALASRTIDGFAAEFDEVCALLRERIARAA